MSRECVGLVSAITALAISACTLQLAGCAPRLAQTPPSLPVSTSTVEPSQVIECEGFTISLIDYYWEDNKLVTRFSFFNDRSKKNEYVDMYAYDQDENRVWGERGTWPMGVTVPILWPGETKENTVTWQCGPRSAVITITFRFGEWPEYVRETFSITRENGVEDDR